MSRFFSEWHDKTYTFAANFPFVEWFRTAVAVRTTLIVLIAILLVARRCAARDIIIVLAVILLILLWGFSSRISCSLECVIAFVFVRKRGRFFHCSCSSIKEAFSSSLILTLQWDDDDTQKNYLAWYEMNGNSWLWRQPGFTAIRKKISVGRKSMWEQWYRYSLNHGWYQS